jgi:hypothetical protein
MSKQSYVGYLNTTDRLLERYKDEKEKINDDDVTESDFMRDLLDRGLRDRDRRVQLFLRLDLPNRVAARRRWKTIGTEVRAIRR